MNYTLASESEHLENGETRQAYRNSKVFENPARFFDMWPDNCADIQANATDTQAPP